MKNLKPVLFIAVLALIGVTAGILSHARANQRLGLPGVKTQPLEGSQNLEVMLPADVPGYQSEKIMEAEVVTNSLPRDTSFGQRVYIAADGFNSTANVVLMGSSRGSMHDPHICLTAQGWIINNASSRVETVHLEKPVPYDLPVMRLNATYQGTVNGQAVIAKGIYLYWFVDADRLTALRSHVMLRMTRDMVVNNVLDRWAYISFFSRCLPGQEDATFDRMKKLITASVPEFQLVPQVPK